LFSLTDYSVPSLFQKNVYALEIFAEYSASSLPARAFLLSLPVLLVTTAVILASQSALHSVAQVSGGARLWASPPSWPPVFSGFQAAALAILGFQIMVPFLGLVKAVGAWPNLVAALSAARSEVAFTFWVAAVTALFCLPISLVIDAELGRGGRPGWLAVTAPLAVPAPLVGIGLIVLWNHPFFPGLYGSRWMPVLAGLARFTPLAVILIYAQMRRIHPLLIDAARMLQPDSIRTWLLIRLPMLAPGLLAAAGLVFALTLGELGATLIVAPPGQATLTLRIYNYLHYGASDTVAGLCLLMVAAALAAGCLAVAALSGWSRWTAMAYPVEGDE